MAATIECANGQNRPSGSESCHLINGKAFFIHLRPLVIIDLLDHDCRKLLESMYWLFLFFSCEIFLFLILPFSGGVEIDYITQYRLSC